MALSIPDIFTVSLCLTSLYVSSLLVYRLYLSPLSKFPGPKLAAATLWYEFYYDVVKRGRYMWKIEELHRQYGPIIRISPHELHVDDPHFYDELFAHGSRQTMKYEWAMRAFGPITSAFQTISHDLHRVRRNALAPFLSKTTVRQMEPLVQRVVDRLRSRFQATKGTGAVINLMHAFTALTNDIICEYAFASPQNFVDHPEYGREWADAMVDIFESCLLFKQFPWIDVLMRKIPPSIASKMNPRLSALFNMAQVCQGKIASIKAEVTRGKNNPGQRTIFLELMDNHQLTAEDKTDERLEGEGMSLMAAGSNTSAHTLTIIMYHLTRNHSLGSTLKRELQKAKSGSHEMLNWSELEQLPYLNAVITEGLRWSCGVTSHLSRIFPDVDLTFHDWTIPRGTPVGMRIPFTHYNEEIFVNPKTFDPERWLRPESDRLRKYMIAFGKGSRQCLGMNLAYCELYLTVANLFGPAGLNFELFETDDSDVEIAHDMFVPFARLNSKGVRVTVD